MSQTIVGQQVANFVLHIVLFGLKLGEIFNFRFPSIKSLLQHVSCVDSNMCKINFYVKLGLYRFYF